jgi:hypothetical protein
VPHVDPDRLVRLALAELNADLTESEHFEQCSLCRHELDSLRHIAHLARHTQGLADLPAPPERVWQRIAAATISTEPTPRKPAQPQPRAASERTFDRRSVPPWARQVSLALAASFLSVVLTLAGLRLFEPPPSTGPTVAASAQLAALPTAPSGSRGVARVVDEDAGQRLHLHVTGLPLRPGYYEVWLIDPDTFQMVSLGVLSDGGDELLPLPSTIDLHRYRVVDVSAEDFDGNALHSGQSMLRGTLST